MKNEPSMTRDTFDRLVFNAPVSSVLNKVVTYRHLLDNKCILTSISTGVYANGIITYDEDFGKSNVHWSFIISITDREPNWQSKQRGR